MDEDSQECNTDATKCRRSKIRTIGNGILILWSVTVERCGSARKYYRVYRSKTRVIRILKLQRANGGMTRVNRIAILNLQTVEVAG